MDCVSINSTCHVSTQDDANGSSQSSSTTMVAATYFNSSFASSDRGGGSADGSQMVNSVSSGSNITHRSMPANTLKLNMSSTAAVAEAAMAATLNNTVCSSLQNSRLNNTSRNVHEISTTSNFFPSDVLMSIVEGRGKAKGEIGLAYIDLSSPILYLAQFMDNCSFDSLKMKCHVCSPAEIIFPNTLTENNMMMSSLVENFPNIDFKSFDRRFFNEKKGFEFVQTLCYKDYTWIDIELESKFYCLSACAALIHYINSVKQIQYASKSMKIIFQSSLNTMVIDPTTAKILELIINLSNPKSSETLFGTINRTKTKSGYVLLRSNILQPSTSVEVITQRLDMVEAILSSIEIFNNFENILNQFSCVNLDQLLVNMVQLPNLTNALLIRSAEKKIEYVIHMKHVISLVDPLRKVLESCTGSCSIFGAYVEQLKDDDFHAIQDMIDQVINSNTQFSRGTANMKLEKCFAIKDRFNALLDLARSIYSETIDDIIALVKTYETKFNIDGIKICNSSVKGFFMQIKQTKERPSIKLPSIFCDVNTKKNHITFTTEDLMRLNNRINQAVEEIYLQSDQIISKLINDIRTKISCFYNLTDIVANVDLLFSFAYQCSCSNYTRPTFDSFIEVKNATHPVLDKISFAVSNSLQLTPDLNFHIITGPNMSGKTTFLKQIALIQIMAQIGSFVPAESATIRICDKLFTRMALNDNLQMNSSSFMVEVKELNYILNNLSPNCLILIDELGRGSVFNETLSVCWAICESLLASTAFTVFATHFIELTALSEVYFNVTNYHFSSEIVEENFVCKYPHVLLPGPTSERFYGIKLAELSGLDRTIIDSARNIAMRLADTSSKQIEDEQSENRRAKYQLAAMLIHEVIYKKQSLDMDLISRIQHQCE